MDKPIKVSLCSQGTLIPPSHHILRIDFEKDLKWVLMVEKDVRFA